MLTPEAKVTNSYMTYAVTCCLPVQGWWELKMHKTMFSKSIKPAKAFGLRGESLCEHQAKMMFLSRLFLENFPGYFPEDLKPEELLDLITFPLVKNVGQIKTGNLLKDGRKITKGKMKKGRDYFIDFARIAFNEKNATEYVRIYDSVNTSDAGMAIEGISMLEYCLTLCFLESNGVAVSYRKRDIITDRVKWLIRKIDTDNSLDVFAADMVDKIKDYPRNIKDPLCFVLSEAVKLARKGKFFSWWHVFMEE